MKLSLVILVFSYVNAMRLSQSNLKLKRELLNPDSFSDNDMAETKTNLASVATSNLGSIPIDKDDETPVIKIGNKNSKKHHDNGHCGSNKPLTTPSPSSSLKPVITNPIGTAAPTQSPSPQINLALLGTPTPTLSPPPLSTSASALPLASYAPEGSADSSYKSIVPPSDSLNPVLESSASRIISYFTFSFLVALFF
jgi:hypothetical protein